GESNGLVSDCPLICLISTRRSLRSREDAHAASIGRPKLSRSTGYIQPSLRLALWEIASNSLPALRCESIHFQRSSGWLESSELYGISGTLAQSLKKMLRCRLR